jgi:hypothetical protein
MPGDKNRIEAKHKLAKKLEKRTSKNAVFITKVKV